MNPPELALRFDAGRQVWRVSLFRGIGGVTIATVARDELHRFLIACRRPVKLTLAPRSAP